MRIVNVFDAVQEGNFKEFKRLYTDDVNVIDRYSSFNLLQSVLISTNNEAERLKIIDFLLEHNIDISYQDKKYHRNALHCIIIKTAVFNSNFWLKAAVFAVFKHVFYFNVGKSIYLINLKQYL